MKWKKTIVVNMKVPVEQETLMWTGKEMIVINYCY